MAPDDAADFIAALPKGKAAKLLPKLKASADIRKLIAYAPDTAGAIMTTRVLTVAESFPAGQALAEVRRWEPDGEALFYLLVVDPAGRLVGSVDLFELIRASSTQPLSALMNTGVVSVHADTDREECAALLEVAAKRIGLGPSLLSGPAITTLVDSVGLLIYFSIAGYVFGV